MRRALAIDEASLGSEHPRVAGHLNHLALLLCDMNRLKDAELLMRRVLAINKTRLGSEHPKVAVDLNNLAQLLHKTNRLKEAVSLSRHAVEILLLSMEQTGYEHSLFKLTVHNHKALLAEMGRDKEEQEAAVEQLIESAKAVVLSQKIKQP